MFLIVAAAGLGFDVGAEKAFKAASARGIAKNVCNYPL
jgi:hypothetical protein